MRSRTIQKRFCGHVGGGTHTEHFNKHNWEYAFYFFPYKNENWRDYTLADYEVPHFPDHYSIRTFYDKYNNLTEILYYIYNTKVPKKEFKASIQQYLSIRDRQKKLEMI